MNRLSSIGIARVVHAIAAVTALMFGTIAQALPTTTVIVHGFTTGEKGSWVQAMAGAVLGRTGGVGSVYRYTGDTGVWTSVSGIGDGSAQNIVLIFNWVPESAGVDSGPNWHYVQAAGDVLYAMMRDAAYASGNSGPNDLATGRVMHFMGHSRGACVISETIRRFALAGIPVDQMTTHDPHPVDGTLDSPYNFDWGDPTPMRWNNVTWADNYWRADGGGIINGLDFDGIPLSNVFNTGLSESVLNSGGYSFSHSDVHLWYHGTVDLSPNPNDGEQTITNAMRSTWWAPDGYTQRGYYYSVIGGGSGLRPAISAGVAPAADSAPTIYNGDFDQGTYAGWSYHGGNGANVISEAGNWYDRLNSGAPTLTHNRFFVPSGPTQVSLKLRRNGTGSTNDVVKIALQRDDDAQAIMIAASNWLVSGLTSSFATYNVTIPAGFGGRTCRMSVVLDGAGDGVNSTVDTDDVAIQVMTVSGDLTGDGLVNIDDLTQVILNWGSSGPAGDANGDGFVNIDDLTMVILGWSS
ncbi:MAG TPA: hypothetical protein VG711_06905 [Phycisphaerales bacterium]|nr:hypothetical protein [Phycisphaerales bacterium]